MIDDHLLGPRLDQSTIIQQIIIIDTELLKISLDTFAGYVTNSHREHQLWTIPFKFQHILLGRKARLAARLPAYGGHANINKHSE
jgi:hypothetical protein